MTKGYSFYKWHGRWRWGFSVDRQGASLCLGPYEWYLIWIDQERES